MNNDVYFEKLVQEAQDIVDSMGIVDDNERISVLEMVFRRHPIRTIVSSILF